MAQLKLNLEAFKHAKKLIEEGKIDFNNNWIIAKPNSESSNSYIAEKGWEGYGEWFLGINPDKKKNEKHFYELPYGNFKKVHKEGLRLAYRYAVEENCTDIQKAVEELLEVVEKLYAIRHS